MRSLVREGEAVARWDVARPPRPSRTAGVRLAGFRDRGAGPVAVQVVPYPAVTLVLEFGDGPFTIDDATGRQHRGSLVAGLAPGAARMRGEKVMCVEVRLSPVVAYSVLGVCPAELDHTVVALDGLWGRDVSRLREQLAAAPSWEDRFTLTDALLTRRCETGPAVDPEVARAWDRIVVSRGWVRVEDLAAEVGWSRRRLWSRFRSQIGLPPQARCDAGPLPACCPSPDHGRQHGPGRGRVRLRRPVPSPPGGWGVHRNDSGDAGR